MAFLQVLVLSPFRARVILDGPVSVFTPGILQAANWTVARSDGAGGRRILATAVWQIDATGVEIALSLALPEHTLFTFSYAPAGSEQAQWTPPLRQAPGVQETPSPEDEAFGVDWDWLAPALDASRNIPVIRGRQCLRNDLVAIAKTEPNELFHRPGEGAGLLSKVNGLDGTPRAIDEIGSAIHRSTMNDARVRDATVSVVPDRKGGVTATISAQPIAIDEPETAIAQA